MSTSIVKPSPAREILARITRMAGTIGGLDATLMMAQYTSPLVIALLLKLAQLRARMQVRFSISGAKLSGGGAGLVALAEGWGQAAGSVGEARTIMRLVGLFPIIQWLLTLHPRPLASLRSLFSLSKPALPCPKTLATIQALSLLFYYPLEHTAWLAGKGVVRITPAQRGKASLWSVRFWAVYVMLEIFKLHQTYMSLGKRTRILASTKPEIKAVEAEGYELQEETQREETESSPSADDRSVQVKALKNDWSMWQNAVMTNSGYAPLTIHWSKPGGLWTSPFITAGFGTVAAVGKIFAQWRAAAV